MKTILVVDDIKAELKLISGYLQQGGYDTITAINGQEALEKAVETKPDLIITDLVMPEMNGLTLCRQVKKNTTTADIPIIACTSKNRDVDRSWAKKQGVAAYIVKPFTKEELIDAVKSITN